MKSVIEQGGVQIGERCHGGAGRIRHPTIPEEREEVQPREGRVWQGLCLALLCPCSQLSAQEILVEFGSARLSPA